LSDDDDQGNGQCKCIAIPYPLSTKPVVSQTPMRRDQASMLCENAPRLVQVRFTLRPGTPPLSPIHGPSVTLSIQPHPDTVAHPIPTPNGVAFSAVPAPAPAPGAHTQLGSGNGADAARVILVPSSLPHLSSTARGPLSRTSNTYSRASTDSGSRSISAPTTPASASLSTPGAWSGRGAESEAAFCRVRLRERASQGWRHIPALLAPRNRFQRPTGAHTRLSQAHTATDSHTCPRPRRTRPALYTQQTSSHGFPEADKPMRTTLLWGPIEKPWMVSTRKRESGKE
jgi:hypothetical protein